MTIKRDSAGVIDLYFDMMDDLTANKDMPFEKRVKLLGQLTNGALAFAKLELEHKKMILRSPDVAKKVTTLQLGHPRAIEGEAEVETEAPAEPAAEK